ncbi:MAG TPA: chemotaxis protein CheW [Nannocystaceae bacterium]|nr:chemotaxis protein CheW [Nannocystaceae bacterium]
MARVLVCRIRNVLAGLRIGDVVETLRPLPVEPLADKPAFVAGLAIIRGLPTPVVDVGALLGVGGASDWTRFVTVRTRHGEVALAVDAVIGVSEVADAEFRELPSLVQTADARHVATVAARDQALLFVLEAARVIEAAQIVPSDLSERAVRQ